MDIDAFEALFKVCEYGVHSKGEELHRELVALTDCKSCVFNTASENGVDYYNRHMVIIEILVPLDNVFTEPFFPEYHEAPGQHHVTECCDQVCVENATACFEGGSCMDGISGSCDSMGDAPVASSD